MFDVAISLMVELIHFMPVIIVCVLAFNIISDLLFSK